MAIYILGKEPFFPYPAKTSPEGIVAVGGDLSPIRLLNAYASGIFPWFNENDPIIWWSPDPRLVLFPPELHVSRRMQRLIDQQLFRVTVDRDFPAIIDHCRTLRKNQPGTWITQEMKDAYIHLYKLGFAHSIEVWQENQLAGGLYGLSLGSCFFGESMFFLVPNASKVGFIFLVRHLERRGFSLVDCQVPTPHLKSLGAQEIPRKNFLALLQRALKNETIKGRWDFLNESPEL